MTNRDKLVSILLRAVSDGHCLDSRADLEELADYLSANVAPVVHGRWIHPKGYVVSNGFLCSVCGHEETSYYAINPRHDCCIADEHGNFYHPPKINYCPNCGTKMDAELLKGGEG